MPVEEVPYAVSNLEIPVGGDCPLVHADLQAAFAEQMLEAGAHEALVAGLQQPSDAAAMPSEVIDLTEDDAVVDLTADEATGGAPAVLAAAAPSPSPVTASLSPTAAILLPAAQAAVVAWAEDVNQAAASPTVACLPPQFGPGPFAGFVPPMSAHPSIRRQHDLMLDRLRASAYDCLPSASGHFGRGRDMHRLAPHA